MATKYNAKIETILVTTLAMGATVAQAARQAGISERTVYRRRQLPEFQARVDAIQNDTLQRVVTILTKAAEQGIHTLVSLQTNATPPNVRRAAARDILDVGMRLREAAELEKRLQALENDVLRATASVVPAVVPTNPPPGNGSGTRRRRGDTALQAALANGDSVAQAAAKAQLSERTVYRRLQDTAFRRGIEALSADMVQRAAALLIAASLLATKTLIELQNPAIPASVRRRASRDVIELGQKLRQTVILDKRLADLEKQLLLSQKPPHLKQT